MSKTIKRRYTKEENEYIVNAIIKDPWNISKVIKQLSIDLDRTEAGLRQHWYTRLSKKTDKCFLVVGKSSHSKNRKNNGKIEKPSKSKKNIWKYLISLLK